jgi:hypothetical protein
MKGKGPAIVTGFLLAAGACALKVKREAARAEELAWKACRNAACDFSSPLFSVESITTSDSDLYIGATRHNKSGTRTESTGGFLN